MFYPHRHFYVTQNFVGEWCVCEDNSFWSVYFATKYRAQFTRDLMLKWLCNHDYNRIKAFINWLERYSYDTSDWPSVRLQLLVIDKAPYMSI